MQTRRRVLLSGSAALATLGMGRSERLLLLNTAPVAAVPAPTATTDLSFTTGTLDGSVTFTRASGATYFDSSNTLQTAATNAARFDYGPTSVSPLGLLIEEARTNGIRNNTMAGAAAGTPGTLPTNWVNNIPAGLTVNVIGTGTENGISYIDIQWVGTTSGTSIVLGFESNSAISAVQNQTFTTSFYVKLAGGTLTNITALQVGGFDYTAATSFIGTNTTNVASPTAAALATQRVSASWTIPDATAGFIRPFIGFVCNTASAVNMTIRIGLPQTELGGFASSAITTSGAAATRAADNAVATVSVGAGAAGSVEAEYLPEFAGTAAAALYAVSVDDATTSNRYALQSKGTGTAVATGLVTTGGSGTASATLLTDVVGTVSKLAMAWSGSTSQNSVGNAGTVQATASAAPAGTLTKLNLGNTATTGQMNGWLRRVRYWNSTLSNAQLQTVTT